MESVRVAGLLVLVLLLICGGCAVPKKFANGQPRYQGSFDKSKRKTGQWVYFYPDGGKRCEGRYDAGNREGKWRWYFPNGGLRKEMEFKGHFADGPYKEFAPNGRLVASGGFARGRKMGPWKISNAGGRPLAELYYVNGRLDGKCVFFNRNKDGDLEWKSVETFENGKRKKVWLESPSGKEWNLVVDREKTIFAWKNDQVPSLKDEHLTMMRADRDKIMALFEKEDAFIGGVRKFGSAYGSTWDTPPRRR